MERGCSAKGSAVVVYNITEVERVCSAEGALMACFRSNGVASE